MTRDPDFAELDAAAEERYRRAGRGCQCGEDWPGRCPGPAFCPCVGDLEGDEG